MEESGANRRRMEPQNPEQIIEEQQRVIKNLQAQLATKVAEIAAKDKRIQELEDQAKPKNLESPPVAEGKMKNIMELPDEYLLEIMSYLSNYDILRNVAGVSKKFHKLSQDQHLIRKIEVDSESWPINQEEEYCKGFLEVLKRSLKLTFLSFEFGRDVSEEKFLEALPSMNHQFLKELCLKSNERNKSRDLSPFNPEDVLIYIEKCPNLKVLKFEFGPFDDLEDNHIYYMGIEYFWNQLQ